MRSYTLDSLDLSSTPDPGTISSLIFHIHARYQALRTEQHLESESHYTETSGKLALEAYNDESIRSERERWCARATAAIHEIVQANKQTIRHVELILPAGGIATPVNICSSLKELTHLESLSLQWPLRGYMPLTLLLMSQWHHILENNIISSFAEFHADLMSALAMHAATLKRLRISLPQSTTQRPFSALSINAQSFPVLPVLEILDLTHWSPRVPDLLTLLSPYGPLPNLQHLIIDHGAEIPLTDNDDDDDEDEVTQDFDKAETEAHACSWAALGTHLAAHKDTLQLRSLNAALHDARETYHPIAHRLDVAELRNAIGAAAVDDLVLCTAWPVEYSPQEPTPAESEVKRGEGDLYAHTPGCGHLAYPADQRPTTGLWPAEGEEARAMQNLKGRPWY
ncbi:hypothetical protein B0H19DRAFT_1197369 [Mycena capillaripes]|nr:hypothetical protein B0H19DRAFT_1197369 [Mycena capillaripes]